MDLLKKAKGLPKSPGVYLMKDSIDNIIYVGKSKNLRSRVSSYFQPSNKDPRIEKLIQNIKCFEYNTTHTELEAFLLECQLIKKLRPRYNSQMKKDKGYVYIKITIDESYPLVQQVLERKNDQARYFGPFNNKNAVERVLTFIYEYFPLRTSRAELNSSTWKEVQNRLGRITLRNRVEVSELEYQSYIKQITGLLTGEEKELIDTIEIEMEKASACFNFELAAYYRDIYQAMQQVIEKQQMIKISGGNRKIVAAETIDEHQMKLFYIEGFKVIHSDLMEIPRCSAALQKIIIKTIYDVFTKTSGGSAKNLAKEEIDEAQILFSYLKNHQSRVPILLIAQKWMKDSNSKSMEEKVMKFAEKILGS